MKFPVSLLPKVKAAARAPPTGIAASGGAETNSAAKGMVWISGGEFTMGSDDESSRRNEQPPHRVKVDGFWMDEHVVTNEEFKKFVEAMGYLTTAERKPD